MPFKKSDETVMKESRVFKSFVEAQAVFENFKEEETERLHAIEYIMYHKEIYYTLEILNKLFKDSNVKDHIYINFVFTNLDIKPKREEDFNKLFEMLKSKNAYLRNSVIAFLQEYGKEVIPFIQKLMDDEDRDIRIFAMNILGDVQFEDSIEMLRSFIAKEKDINALMTAVDYLGEVGDESDILRLKNIQQVHEDEPYVVFGVDLALSRLKGQP